MKAGTVFVKAGTVPYFCEKALFLGRQAKPFTRPRDHLFSSLEKERN